MPNDQGQIVIRKATEAYVGQIAEILVEDWKRAYRGIMDSAFLDAMIVWCLKENQEARKFYESMGGKADQTGTHTWGNRVYDMISYHYRMDE